MRILFLGDYSNMHACLAAELRLRGHQVTVVSDAGGYQHTQCDVMLERSPGVRGALRYLNDIFRLSAEWRGYDVVQLINPHFLKLKPGKLSYFFNMLRRRNGSLFLTLAGNDHHFVKQCVKGSIFPYSEFRVGSAPTPFALSNPKREQNWLAREVADYSKMVYDNIDGALSALYEYDIAARDILGDRLAYGGIPIDCIRLREQPWDDSIPLRLLIGKRPGMEIQKGLERIEKAARKLENEMPDKVRVSVVGGLSLEDYRREVAASHVVLDQLYAMSPATNALEAMAMGRVAASGGQPEFYDFIGEREMHPVVALNPEKDICEELRGLVENRADLRARAHTGREFVERHNSAAVVASRFERHWREILEKK